MADSSWVSKKETTTPAMQHSLTVFKDTTKFGTRVWPGSPQPLGATWDGKGVNVAIFSENAERVELCLFDEKGKRETVRIALPEYTNQKWHGYFPDLRRLKCPLSRRVSESNRTSRRHAGNGEIGRCCRSDLMS